MHNIILLGPPGSGKSTQARALVERFGCEHIETGTVLREVAKADTPLGREIDRIIHTEKVLVPDEIVAPALEGALQQVSWQALYYYYYDEWNYGRLASGLDCWLEACVSK